VELGEGRWLAGLGLVALTLVLSALAFFVRPGHRRTLVFTAAGLECRWWLTRKTIRTPSRVNAAIDQPVPVSASLAGTQMRQLLPAPVRASYRRISCCSGGTSVI